MNRAFENWFRFNFELGYGYIVNCSFACFRMCLCIINCIQSFVGVPRKSNFVIFRTLGAYRFELWCKKSPIGISVRFPQAAEVEMHCETTVFSIFYSIFQFTIIRKTFVHQTCLALPPVMLTIFRLLLNTTKQFVQGVPRVTYIFLWASSCVTTPKYYAYQLENSIDQ